MLLLPSLAGLPASWQDGEEAGRDSLRLSLDDCVEIAVRNNLELEQERIATDIAVYNARGSWGFYDPVVGLTGSFVDQEQESNFQFAGDDVIETDTFALDGQLDVPLYTGGDVSLGFRRANSDTTNQAVPVNPETRDTISLSFRQPLLRGAWPRFATAEQRALELELRRQQERMRQVRDDVVQGVHDAYWDLVAAIEERRVREVSIERARRQLAQNQRRLEVGVGTEVDVLQAETEVATREEQLLQAEHAVRTSLDALKSMLWRGEEQAGWEAGLEWWDLPIEPLTPLPEVGLGGVPSELSWTASLHVALTRRSELRQQLFAIEAAERRRSAAWSQRLPALDLTLSSESEGFDGEGTEAFEEALGWEFPTHTISLGFSMPVFNRTARFALRSARAELRSAELAYDQIELQVIGEVRAGVRDVVFSAEAVSAARKSVQLGRRQLAAEEARYQEGLSTTFQVLEFQETLAEALSNEKSALANYAKALAALRRAEGRLSDGWDVPVGETE